MLKLTIITIILLKISDSKGAVENITYCNLTTELLNSNINTLKDCENFVGTILITYNTFSRMHPNDLNILKSIKTIKGHIIINAHHELFTSLDFLENLESIEDASGYSNKICVVINGTSLKSIYLPKLKRISCNVRIEDNKELCYDVQWLNPIFMNQAFVLRSIVANNLVDKRNCHCNELCSEGKCWGPGANQCSDRKDEKYFNESTLTTAIAVNCDENQYQRNGICRHCHHQCKNGCRGPGSRHCTSCKYVKDENRCKASCPVNKYPTNGTCAACHYACYRGCTGPKSNYGDGGCNFCMKLIMVQDDIFCHPLEDSCPVGYINSTLTSDIDRLVIFNGQVLCIPEDNSMKMLFYIIIPTVATVLIVICIVIVYLCRSRISSIYRKTDQVDKNQIQNTNNVHKPLLSQLSIIKETEIRKVKILGKGAFGTVYEAVLKRDDSSTKISVALKVLHDESSSNASKEFLAEALIMASLDHIHIVHLVAVCVTTDIMIVTKLMPLGSILNHVRNKRHHIPPKGLLTWSAQIAKGMAYLEDKHLVHRDLAARNVLLESEDCVKIADFGMSKYVGTHELLQTDTKFPIKWLAPESLEEKQFTHKSDIWSFGVTVWELLTYGAKPFENIQANVLLKNLMRGSRLEQPANCSADVYAVLIICWLLKPERRPHFAELAITFQKMSYESSKYISGYGKEEFMKLNSPQQIQSYTSSFEDKNSDLYNEQDGYLKPIKQISSGCSKYGYVVKQARV